MWAFSPFVEIQMFSDFICLFTCVILQPSYYNLLYTPFPLSTSTYICPLDPFVHSMYPTPSPRYSLVQTALPHGYGRDRGSSRMLTTTTSVASQRGLASATVDNSTTFPTSYFTSWTLLVVEVSGMLSNASESHIQVIGCM